MATFANNLKLKILATGEGSGSWGTTTNNNLKQLAEALGYATQAVFSSNADQTITFPEDETTGIAAKSMYFKVTGSATLDATRKLTITNNDITRVMMVENATTGSQSIIFRQAGGSGSTVTIPNGRAKLIYMDGTGANANVIDISAELSLTGVAIDGSSTFTGAITGSSYAGTIDATSIEFDTLSGTGAVTITDILDEDNMASNSATMLATQQSIKAYVDSQIQTVDTLSEILAQTSGNTTGGTKISVDNTSGGIDFIDNAKIRFGTGNDLEIYHEGSASIIAEPAGTGDLLIRGNNLKLQKGDGGEDYLIATANGSVAIKHDNATKLETTSSGIDVTGEVKGDTLDIDGNAAITGTVTIDPPLLTGETEALGAKGIIMKQGDLRMKVDGDYDADASTNSKGGSLQNNSRIIFDSEQHEHIQHETLGFRNPAFVIQANYDHSAGYGSGGAGTEFLNANISQLGNGDLTISSGKLQLRGKVETPDDGQGSGGYNDVASGDDYIDHDSYMGITIDGSTTQGTVTRLHYGFTNHNDRNMRLEPSVSGIIVEGMGDATGNGTNTVSNSGTIGTYNDIDLITLAQNQVTVAGELEATTLDINGAASIAGAVTDVTALTVDSIKIDGTTIGHTSDTDLLTLASQKLTITGDASAGGIGDSDHALVVEGAVTIKGTSDGGQLIIENSGTSGSDNPDIVLFNNNSGNGSDGDKLGGLHFYGKDDAGNHTNYGNIVAEVVTAANGSTEAGKIVIRPRTANSAGTDILTILGDRVQVPDDIKMAFGDGSDLVISHKSANGNSVIRETGSGNLILQADDLQFDDTNSNKFIKCVEGGAVQVFHNQASNATAKLETTADGIQVNTDLLLFEEDSDSNANAGPTLTLQRKTSGTHPQTNDNLGEIVFKGEDGGGTDTTYVKLLTSIADATAGSEDAKFIIQGVKGGVETKNLALFRAGLISLGQRNAEDGTARNENQPVEINGPHYSRVGGLSGNRFVHSEQGLNLEGAYTNPPKNGKVITNISNTSSGTACVVTTDGNHGFTDNMFLYVDNTGNALLDGKSFFIMTVDGQPTKLTLNNAYDGGNPQHSGAEENSGVIGGLGFGLRIHNTQSNSTYEQDCSIELGGNDDVFIDLKKPNDNDYDLRVAHLSDNVSYVSSKTGHLVLKTETNGSSVLLQHEGANTKLETTDTGVTITGTAVATAFTGALTGNVTGNVSGSSGSCTGNSATATSATSATFAKGVLVDGAGANVVEDSTTNRDHDVVKTFVGKTFIYTGSGDITLGLPSVGDDIQIGEQIELINASTTDGAEIILDLDDCDGTAQTVRILTGSAAVNESSNDPHISDGGSVTLIGIATDTYVLFGAGIEDN